MMHPPGYRFGPLPGRPCTPPGTGLDPCQGDHAHMHRCTHAHVLHTVPPPPQGDALLTEPLLPSSAPPSVLSPLGPPAQAPGDGKGLLSSASLPLLAAYSQLEPYQTFLQLDAGEWPQQPLNLRRVSSVATEEGGSMHGGSLMASYHSSHRNIVVGAVAGGGVPTPLLASPVLPSLLGQAQRAVDVASSYPYPPMSPLPPAAFEVDQENEDGGEREGLLRGSPAHATSTPHAPVVDEHGWGPAVDERQATFTGRSSVNEAVRLIWPALLPLLIQSTVPLIIFPFFTFIPSSGAIGEALPKVRLLVWVRGPEVCAGALGWGRGGWGGGGGACKL
jgi:hypothetical protein